MFATLSIGLDLIEPTFNNSDLILEWLHPEIFANNTLLVLFRIFLALSPKSTFSVQTGS